MSSRRIPIPGCPANTNLPWRQRNPAVPTPSLSRPSLKWHSSASAPNLWQSRRLVRTLNPNQLERLTSVRRRLPNKFETCNYFRKRADPALKHGLGKTATGLNKPSTGIALTVDGARNGDLSHSARPESTSSIEPSGANDRQSGHGAQTGGAPVLDVAQRMRLSAVKKFGSHVG